MAEEKPELEARWRLLAAFPASFDAAAAAAVWEADTDDAAHDLGELRLRSMVLWDQADDRWRLHDLMRDVAGVALEEQDQAALEARVETAQERHARHYCGVLATANDLYLKGGEGVLAGLARYDLEQRNIAAGQAWAVARIEQDDASARLAGDFANVGAYVLHIRLHPRERIAWLEAQRKACVRLGDRRGEGNALGNLGLAWADLGEPRRAIEFYEQRLVIAREIGDRRGEGNALGNLGLAWADLGEPRRAIEFHEQQLVIVREIGDRRGEGATLGNLGLAWADLGEPRRAIEFYEQALVIDREIGDRRGEGAISAVWAWPGRPSANRGGRSSSTSVAGDRARDRRPARRGRRARQSGQCLGGPRRAAAGDRATSSSSRVRAIGDRTGEGNALGNLGVAHDVLGQRNQAVRSMQDALRIFGSGQALVEQAPAQSLGRGDRAANRRTAGASRCRRACRLGG